VILLDRLLPSRQTVDLALNPRPVAIASPAAGGGVSGITAAITRAQLERVNASAGMSIPAVRRAVHVIAGTISTFGLSAWRDGVRLPRSDSACPVWLGQPDPKQTLSSTLYRTIVDGIWRDRCCWRIVDRNVWGQPVGFRHLPADTVDYVTDPTTGTVEAITVGGTQYAGDDLRGFVIFDWSGVGGLRRFGFDMLNLYAALQAAAANYAAAPHPKAILKNHGADLTDPEIDALLTAWESARASRSVGYLNDVVDYDTFGWNASDLQLTEAREHAALEVARLFGLPARALDAQGGDSMTYANVTEARVDTVESLRPWMTPLEQTLSLDDRTGTTSGLYTSRGVSIRLDVTAFTRDQPAARMAMWAQAIASGVLTVEEARRLEPLASEEIPI
jgi:HK97 family phage portal protein